MSAAVERVKASLQSVRASRWGLRPPVVRSPVKRVGDSEGQSQRHLAVGKNAPLGSVASSSTTSSGELETVKARVR